MREIISVHVGKAGIEQGIANWDLLAKEYQIDREGSIDQSSETDNYQIFFNENHDGKYKPRAAFIDTDDLIIRDLKESCYKNFFNPNNMKFGKDESAGNFARGMYTVGKEIFDDSFDIVRKMAEAADSLQGIQFYSSSGGGTGGGLGSSLMERATAEFKGVPKIAFVHNPSYQRSTVTTEYYNQILSSQWLNDHTDLVFHISSDRSINLLKN